MSQENIEVVRSALDAWNRGDVDAFLASAHPDIEFRPSGVFLGMDPIYRGHAELRHFWDVFHEPWASIKIRIDQVREVADQVVPLAMFEGYAREGITVRREVAWTWQFVGNLYIRVNAFSSWNEALEAVGLRE